MPEITIGKWKMRNGEPAIVVATSNPIGRDKDYPVVGWTKGGLCTWTKEGRTVAGCTGEDDLIAPWPEDPPAPLKLEVGKIYEEESGIRVHIFGYVPTNPIAGKVDIAPFVGVDADGNLLCYTPEGKRVRGGRSKDLIREHVPTPTLLEAAKEVRKTWDGKPCEYANPNVRDTLRKLDAAIAAEEAKAGK